MPLNQVSNVSAPEARLLTVTVWDAGLSGLEEAIREAGLGPTPGRRNSNPYSSA